MVHADSLDYDVRKLNTLLILVTVLGQMTCGTLESGVEAESFES